MANPGLQYGPSLDHKNATKHTMKAPRMRYMIMWLILGSNMDLIGTTQMRYMIMWLILGANVDPVWTTKAQQNTHMETPWLLFGYSGLHWGDFQNCHGSIFQNWTPIWT